MSESLPTGWRSVVLGDVADSSLGKMLDRQKHTKGLALPYLRNQNVRWFGIDDRDLSEMFFEDDELERYGLRQGDVLVCEGGEPGRAAIWDGRMVTMKFQKAIHRVRPSDVLLPEWLVFRLWHEAQSGRLERYCTGTTIKHFTGTALATFELPLPPLNEQRRIVAKLEALQARSRRAREALDAVPPLLEKLRQSILAAAFRGDLTKDWRAKHKDVEPASKLLDRIRVERRKKWEEAGASRKQRGAEESELTGLPELPQTWCWACAQELALDDSNAICAGPFGTIFKAKDFRPEGVPIIFLRHVAPGRYLTERPGFMDRQKWEELFRAYSVTGGELLITKLGDPPGACAIYPEGIGASMVTPDVIKMEPDRRLALPLYLMRYFNSELARGITFGMSYGVTRLRMTLELFRGMPVPLAPAEEQAVLVERVEQAFARVGALEGAVGDAGTRLVGLERSTLAKAFRGELVPQDPNDDPADVMLARLKAANGAGSGKPKGARPPQGEEAR